MANMNYLTVYKISAGAFLRPPKSTLGEPGSKRSRQRTEYVLYTLTSENTVHTANEGTSMYVQYTYCTEIFNRFVLEVATTVLY